MPRSARLKSGTGVYHVMLRGANKQDIFYDEEDRRRFIEILKKYKTESGMKLFAWCIMMNHVHLLVKEGEEELSTTMKRIGVSYATFFNLKYATTGHLFQDRFRSERVETLQYLLTVVRYIHQNPVKAGLAKRSDEWKWSSCRTYYQGIQAFHGLLDGDFILEKFAGDPKTARESFIQFNEAPSEEDCLDEQPLRKRLSDEKAVAEIKKLLGEVEIAQVKSLPKRERDDILHQVKRIEGIAQRQAARIFGVSPNYFFKMK